MSILNELRQATGPIHARIETLPVCQALLSGTVDHATYVCLLRPLYHLHAALEARLAACSEMNGVWPATPSRAAALARDLRVFGTDAGPMPNLVQEWESALQLLEQPAAWGGAGYVLEGSRMGSRVLVRPIATALGLDLRLGKGLDYHLDAGDDPAGNWRGVLAALERLATSPTARHALIRAAVLTFETMYTLHESVKPTALAA